jgi:hypothetical protein
MAQSAIFKALSVPEQNLEDLIQGRSLIFLPRQFILPEQQYALYPDQDNSSAETVLIEAWAKCEDCKMVDKSTSLDMLALSIMRSIEELKDIIERKNVLVLAYLRVYRLANPIELPSNQKTQFVNLPETIYVSDDSPILSDSDFARLKQQLENLEPPESLDTKIQRMLREVENQHRIDSAKELSWIETISKLGDRSIEQDEGKSNYQAGTDFENIAKKGLEFLGFTIDESHKGGAGGLDLFCSKPYALTGECKAGKSVPSGTTEELLKLGGMRLGMEKFLDSAKLIVGAGRINPDVITAAHEWKVSIIKAMTLQKLVELKSKYNGAIDLFKLKEKLQAGQIDTKIDEYINDVEGEIKLRSHIVQVVKDFLQNNDLEDSDSNVLFGVYAGSRPPQNLKPNELRDILVELSSPLAGYLGRVEEGGKKCDRFYFLRDLLT